MQRLVSLIFMLLLLGTTARAYNLTVTLAQTNPGIPNAAAGADARWMTDRMNVWHMSGTAEVFTVAGQIAIYFNEVPGLYSPATSNLTLNTGEIQIIAYYRPWTNHISVTVTPNTVPWSISGTFPSTFKITNGVGNLSATNHCPTGAVYNITYSRLQDYYLPATNSIDVSGPGVDAFFSAEYAGYSNSLAVTVAGVSSTNVIWSLAGPAEFTNASSYGVTFTNSYTVTAIPTGSYTITFPAIAGYSNPAAVITNITGASPLVNCITGTYSAVIWYTTTNFPSTNPPAGQLPTNFPVTTNDITLMVDTNGLFKTPSREKIIAANGLFTNNTDWASITNTMTNWTAVPSSSNWLAYDPDTRTLSGCVTNQDNPYWAIHPAFTNINGNANAITNLIRVDFININIAIGPVAVSSNYGISIGRGSTGHTHSVAIGTASAASNQSVAVGPYATAAMYASAVGYYAMADYYGQALGMQTDGRSGGAAIGYQAKAYTRGVSIGYLSRADYYGIALGMNASGTQSGVAIGANAVGTNYAVAVGASAVATTNSVAIGVGVTNMKPGSTRIKGYLNMADYGISNCLNIGATNVNIVSNLFVSNSITLGTNAPITNWPSGSGDAIQGTYPVFLLPVGLVNGAWTDFEIKGSIDNFATAPVYYYKSWAVNVSGNGDASAISFFTDDYSADPRVWNQATPEVSIGSQLSDPLSVVQYVYFMPSHDCAVDWSTWMQATNKNLVWSWVRVDAGAYEMNAGETKQRWNPIRPESWEIERTTP